MEIHDSRPVDYRWHIMMMMSLMCVWLEIRAESSNFKLVYNQSIKFLMKLPLDNP